MGFLSNMLGRATSVADAIKASATDFYLDNARKDDAELGAYLMVSVGYADGGYGTDEQQLTVKALQSIFRNFEPAQIAGFVRSAVQAHADLPELGYIETETRMRDFKDDAGNLRKVVTAAVAIAKMGGIDEAEAALLRRFMAVRSDIRPSDVGL